MNKHAIRETFPPGIVGREIVLAQMCHHYRRISTAKARVNTNLFKPPKLSLSRPLSAEVASIVQRSLSPRSPPKHRRCLKYEHEMGEHHIKPCIRSQTAESRLRSTPEVYHPAVKAPRATIHDNDGQQQATQTSLENSLVEEIIPKTKDEAVQTCYPGLYRPLDARSVQFLRDITTDALQQRAFTSSALNRIFLDHQFRNTYSLTQELMERELEELRRQLGMLPRHSSGSTVSDGEALDALDTLVLDPRIKEQVIHSLRLSRKNDAKRPTYTYFDRLKDETEDELQPTKDRTNTALNNILKSAEQIKDTSNIQQIEEIVQDNSRNDRVTTTDIEEPYRVTTTDIEESDRVTTTDIEEPEKKGGWNAEVEEDEKDVTASSSKDDEEEVKSEEEEEVESMTDSENEVEDIQSGSGSPDEVQSELDEEDDDEITQKEGTISRQITEEKPKSINDSKATKQSDSKSEQSPKPNNAQPNLPPLKLEPITARDKWTTSLEAVKEESDSTTGQVSDISTASTPTEIESKQERTNSALPNKRGKRSSDSSGTYYSAGNTQNSNKTTAEETEPNEETRNSSKASNLISGNQTTSSTGGEIVKQMDDLPESEKETAPNSNSSLGLIVKHISDISDTLNSKQGVKRQEPLRTDQEEEKSETGSEVESVHSESEGEDEDESSEGSEVSSIHTD